MCANPGVGIRGSGVVGMEKPEVYDSGERQEMNITTSCAGKLLCAKQHKG